MKKIFQRSIFVIAAVAVIGLSGCASTGAKGPDKVVYQDRKSVV